VTEFWIDQAALLLIIHAVFNVIVWPAFYRRVARDPRSRDSSGSPTRFLFVHTTLVGVALLLAIIGAIVAVVVLTRG
jgi:hypothetical protein